MVVLQIGLKLWVVDCGLWVVGCGLWVVGCGLWENKLLILFEKLYS